MASPKVSDDLLPVGYVGLGIMGAPMVRNLLRAGVPVHVWARRLEQAQRLVGDGAVPEESLASLVRTVRVLFLNVSDTPDVEGLMLDEGGIVANARSGLIVVDHSTIDPMRARHIAEKAREAGVTFIDAPVSGGERGAIEGTLTLMLGGPEADIDRIGPLLERVGRTLTRVGDSGAGQIAKACNQLIVGETLVAIGEAFALAEAAGVDPARVREALLGGLANSKVLQMHGQRLLDDDFVPGFMAHLHAKDMGIVANTAASLGLDLSGAERVRAALARALEHGHAYDDSTILARYCIPER
ncbi:2-hydroxy-3-oxopropionate reductase [Thioalkalivibrio nitratireducens DSM 14787]|uniref:2-hydroxy-3-oxopropionate reductase n=1 Tax=Thioalkalivibrio nitratireducens (strain DSM 14787 / UNIQEM 213 / ALEN2) TaxID=1255043 RepID=L0DX22_THIND|nr:NAD(P)-dependent oxidoreductase [Thioalkalivibrio nitratireducens]AGA33510.1 2-hydroxy-3-oxopropionate reductase [Thioalkalivibrio nitratireducens DSM 14787]